MRLRPHTRSNMSIYYILDENRNIIEADLNTWASWFGTADKHVKIDNINEIIISTVFLGLDYAYSFQHTPQIFETMVFDKDGKDTYMTRYDTWEEAEAGHEAAVEWVKNGCKDD